MEDDTYGITRHDCDECGVPGCPLGPGDDWPLCDSCARKIQQEAKR